MVDTALPFVPDLLCFSHLRWDFVFQRPQHLLTRFARDRRVYVFEEAMPDSLAPRLELREAQGGVRVVTPHVPPSFDEEETVGALRRMVDELLRGEELVRYAAWYYTPMALPFSRHLSPVAVAYDCMDELSLFRGAPPLLVELERELLQRADVVFTGGHSLYLAKRHRHANVHSFPSTVDLPHFARAREPQADPADQARIPHPRLGFFGVLDERLDVDLLRGVAQARPDWHLVLIGPVAKIDPASLPRAANIHYLGMKSYGELPAYLAGWDVALLLFARNEATRYISPTKTPEYLAAGKPVVSTSIRDVVRPYGERGLVEIADSPADFVAAVQACLRPDPDRRRRADEFLAGMSWDATWSQMKRLLDHSAQHRHKARVAAGRSAEAK